MIRRVLAGVGLAVVTWGGTALLAAPASAHPLGNFSVNVYNGIVIAPDEVVIDHVLDLAELPTVQAMPQLDADSDESVAVAELDAFAQDRCDVAVRDLEFRVGDAQVPLALHAASATVADGQAGLSTVRIECMARGAVAVNDSEGVSFTDNSVTDEAGWHEVTLRGEGVAVSAADVPTDSQSAALTAYPESLQSAPLRVTTASAMVAVGGAAVGAPGGATSDGLVATTGGADESKPWDWGAELLTGATSTATGPTGMSLAIIVALFVGALHALAPGHGKSLVACALAGRQERAARAAATVGATVTITHTASVLALGLVVAGTATVVPRELYSILGGVTGVVVVVLGLVLLRNAIRGGGHGHAHHGGHEHSHGASHGHEHRDEHGHEHRDEHPHGAGKDGSHGHQPGAQSPIALREHAHAGHHTGLTGHDEPAGKFPQARRGVLVTLGITGGLLPSPSAVVVLLASAASGRAWFGVILVLAFGVGMACTLAGVGFAVLRGQGRLLALAERSPRPWLSSALRRLPSLTAAAVILIGTAVLVSSIA